MNDDLHKKLMLHKFTKILILDQPSDVDEFDGLLFDTHPSGCYDLIIQFVFSLQDMHQAIIGISDAGVMADSGYLYLIYPKKGNKKYTEYIDRDRIFPELGIDDSDGFMPGTTLKFAKMVAFNDIFTLVGLRNMPERPESKKQASARVDDYVALIPSLLGELKNDPAALSIFDKLSFGYQKDWARYVYSTQSEQTRAKRLAEMCDILKAGYKSKELFRQSKKK